MARFGRLLAVLLACALAACAARPSVTAVPSLATPTVPGPALGSPPALTAAGPTATRPAPAATLVSTPPSPQILTPGGKTTPQGATTAPQPDPSPVPPTPPPAPEAATVRFAVIGDYGLSSPAESDVAALVHGWKPDFVITVGDNNYLGGSAATIDRNVGQYYHDFITPYAGGYGEGADRNRFFPTLGNHDCQDPGAKAYLDYFTLPGNERYYDFAWGPVHLFTLDSNPDEPDGIGADSTQASWLRAGLAASKAPWKLVTMHHPPFSSGPHGSTRRLQWPFAAWGASAVLAGHDHIYERIDHDGIPYFVDGVGGSILYALGAPVEGSQARYNADFGAMLVEASEHEITFRFVTRAGETVDSTTLTR